jgi:hypothetical protein
VQKPVLCEIRVAADAAAWAGAGFSVGDGRAVVGGVAIAFLAGEGGLVDWALTDVRSAGIDGLPTRLGSAGGGENGPASHPNGVCAVDHIVVMTPQLERTAAALEGAGIELRRTREGETGMGSRRQGFFRVGTPILEVVEAHELSSGDPARFWGITFVTADLDAAAQLLGDKLGRIKDAVQPGRRIATVRKEAGLGLPVALITPHRKA